MEIRRIFDLLDWMIENHPREDALAEKHNGVWEKFSTNDYYKYAHLLAYGLYEHGVRKGDKIVTVSNNRPSWNFLDMAIGMLGAVHVPIYPTLNTENYRYIFTHCDAKYIFVSNAVLYKRIQAAYDLLENKPFLFSIDQIEGLNNILEILDLGIANKDKNESIVQEIKQSILPDDLFSIVYTSGTTGEPKGVMLSHRNLIFNFTGHAKHQLITSENKVLSFLPLCHIYERSMVYEYQYLGAGVYYAENIGTIAANMMEIHADGFCSVPRVIETIASKFFAAGSDLPFLSRQIYQLAIRHGYKFDWGKHSVWYRFWQRIYDRLVYSKWRANLGGHRLTIISGGSAIQARIVRLFSAAGLCVYEGYGMTETSPVIAVNNPKTGEVKIGTVGVILNGVEVSFSEDGEILTRGPHVMLGYYKDPDYTAKVIDQDGWLHTGDIGTLIDGKYLKITDRKKEIFKLSAGKYVAPQLIENLLKESDFIEQVMVIGENEKFASALVLPNFHQLHAWSEKNRVRYRDNATLIQKEVVHKLYAKIIEEFNKRLSAHEQIKRFRLVEDEWTMQNGLLSPTLKLRRAVLFKKYKDIIDDIYSKNESTPTIAKVFNKDLSQISFASLQNIVPIKKITEAVNARTKGKNKK